MLTHLSIRNVLLIDEITMDVPEGLLVLTGETGAGKSILLDSIGLALGERSETNLVRNGADQASVALSFQLPVRHEAQALLCELGLRDQPSTEPVLLRRLINRDGRSRAFVDDQPVAIAALRKLGALLVDIHGQFETHGLLNRDMHRAYLDDYAGFGERLKKLSQSYAQYQQAVSAYALALEQVQDSARRIEDLTHSVKELRALNPQAGEAENLAHKRALMQAKEKIAESLQAALQEMQGEKGAAQGLANARRILVRAAEKTENVLQPVLDPLTRAEDLLNEANAALDHLVQSDDYDQGTREKLEDRLFALRGAARKYNVTPEDLPALAEKMQADLDAISHSDAHLKKLEAAKTTAEKEFLQQAKTIHDERGKAARKLETAMKAELAPLKLERARLSIKVEELPLEDASAHGLSRVTFTGSTNPDMADAPLHKIASGGELARFMLALRLCLADSSPTTTLIFDEVDTGIGGATADAVGERLHQLGQHMQTLVITHSPQVAARGNHHWHVAKGVTGKTTRTALQALDFDARCEEIARMLAGSTVTDAARDAARSLLKLDAPAPKKQKKAS